MESKSILRKKPELIVVAALMLLAITGTASAAISQDTISFDAAGEWIYKEAVALMWLVAAIVTVVAVILIMSGNSSNRATGKYLMSGIIIGIFLFYIVPWVLQSVHDIATTGTNNTTTLSP